MIDFTLSDEQKQLQELARKFTKEEVIPKAAHHDETGEFPIEIAQKAWDLGLMNTHISQDFGGLGLGVLEEAIIAEELTFGCSGIQTAIFVNSLASGTLASCGWR